MNRSHNFFRKAKTAKLAAFSVEERFAKNAQETLTHKKKLIEKGFQCPKCWLIKRVCICENMPKDVKLKNNVIIYMHFKEFGRSSNTGLDLTNACPNAKLLLCGIPEDEKTLHDVMYKKSDEHKDSTNADRELTFNENTFVLFPSNDSVTAQEFLDRLRVNKKKKEEVHESNNNNHNDEEEDLEPAAKRRRIEVDPVNVIVLDATWNQARALYKRLPTGLPKVRLSEMKETISHLRKQTVEGRVTTAEATLLLLEELGEDKEELSKLWQGLKHRIAAVDSATGRKNEPSEDDPEQHELNSNVK
jgi:DTW domain-containing protein YfiP